MSRIAEFSKKYYIIFSLKVDFLTSYISFRHNSDAWMASAKLHQEKSSKLSR